MQHNQTAAVRRCKCCGVEMASRPGRRPKTYCSNACKQTAYYQRRKTSDNNIVTQRDFVTGCAHSVTNHTDDIAIPQTANPQPFITPHSQASEQKDQALPTYYPSYKTSFMEHHTLSDEHNATDESTSPQSISVMGMEVDKEWFTGLLETLPEDQQRQLSRLLLQTITDVFPDLTDELIVTHSDPYDESPLTDDSSQNDYVQKDEGNEEDNYDDGNGGEEGAGEGHGLEGGGLEDEELYPNEEGDGNEVEDGNGKTQAGAHNDAGIKTYRLNSRESEATVRQPRHGDVHSAFSQQNVTSRNSSHVNHALHCPGGDKGRGHISGYLARFNSPRIRRGLTIWEELSVTIPHFMEDYVMHFASEAGMLVHPAGTKKGGLVTVHILLHLAEHRRPICRLLDLVLEAEDGILREQDFREGGAFTADEIATQDDSYLSPEEGAIDYDCFDSAAATGMIPQGGSRHITAHDIAMYSNIKAVRQLVRPGTTRA